MEEVISVITDLMVWILFIVTLLSSCLLLIVGTVSLISEPTFGSLVYFLGSAAALGLHHLIKNV